MSAYINKKIVFKLIKNSKPFILHSAYGTSSDTKLCIKETIDIQKKILGISPFQILKPVQRIIKKLFFFKDLFNIRKNNNF